MSMRKRFEQQITLGRVLIGDVTIPTQKRMGPLPALFAALKELFTTPKLSGEVFNILEKKIFPKNNHTGRPGMNLWIIFVLAQVRNCKNLSYDDLHYKANNDRLLRSILGVREAMGYYDTEPIRFSYQTIVDNVELLDDATIKEINDLIVKMGAGVFKKKEGEALRLKTDSFVVESNAHFPTDYNLLWDCMRKCLDVIKQWKQKQTLPGWRKHKHWVSDLKNKMRALGRTSSTGGANKKERQITAATAYLDKAKSLSDKLTSTLDNIQNITFEDLPYIFVLREYMGLMDKHIDLVERRLINGETIPHGEKMFSIFERYTEWINKGKKRPRVELGKKVAITSNQYHLIIDYRVMDHQADSEIVEAIYGALDSEIKIASWSFDKGFWNKTNKEFLEEKVGLLVLPKKGKPNKMEAAEEHTLKFKRYRHAHSAIESNINELEHRGLDRCPDRSLPHFKRYVGIAVCAYNLRRIGTELLERQRKEERQLRKKIA